MSYSKQAEHYRHLENSREQEPPPPAYEAEAGPATTPPPANFSSTPRDSPRASPRPSLDGRSRQLTPRASRNFSLPSPGRASLQRDRSYTPPQTRSFSPQQTRNLSEASSKDGTGDLSSAVPSQAISNSVEDNPTVDSPFNFPTSAPLPPAYTAASSTLPSRPIAIPQISPSPASPFLDAWAPLLLSYGITPSSWHAFTSTVSAFLTAKVSDRAISHAGDMAKTIAEGPNNAFKTWVKHTKTVGKGVGKQAKRGNVVGAALGVIGGAVTIPLFAVGGLVGTVASFPGTTIAAAVKRPKTPRQRATAYVAVASEKWLRDRGLCAVILDSDELAKVLRVDENQLLFPGKGDSTGRGAQGEARRLEKFVERLEVRGDGGLELGKETLWLVLSKAVVEEDEGGSSS